MHTNKNMWTLKLIAAALMCSATWSAVDHFGGYLSRALGWDSFPINLVIGAEIYLWAGALWLLKIIDDNVASCAAFSATLVFFGPQLYASWDFTMSPSVYNQKVCAATSWLVIFSILGAVSFDLLVPTKVATIASHKER